MSSPSIKWAMISVLLKCTLPPFYTLRPDDAYMRQSLLVRIMVCCLLDAIFPQVGLMVNDEKKFFNTLNLRHKAASFVKWHLLINFHAWKFFYFDIFKFYWNLFPVAQ